MTAAIDQVALSRALSPKQVHSIAQARARINVWEGSVRSGKTIASLLRWLAFVADPPRDGELVMVGKTRESIHRNLFGPLTNPNLFGPLAYRINYRLGAPTAKIFGRTVHVFGANDEKAEPKIRGLTLAGGYVDETTVIPRSVFDQLLARCSVPGAKVFATTNPDTPAHWFRKYYLLRARETQLATWHFTIDDNPHLDPAYVAWLKSTYVGLWYRRFILGQWVAAEGAVYDTWDPERHVVTFDEVPHIRRWLSTGVDYGTVNPFDATVLGIGADRCIYAVSAWRHDSRRARRQMTDPELSAGMRGWLRAVRLPQTQLRGVQPEVVCVDPSAASFRVQLYRDGMPSMPANNDVLDGIRTVSALLSADKLKVVGVACPDLVEEFPGYSWDDKAAEKGEDAVVKANDHALDGLRYGLHTTRNRWRAEVLPALGDLDDAA